MNSFWTGIFGAKSPTVEYCEKASNSLIARPGYFLSNFVYIFIGIYLLRKRGKLAKVFGLLSILIGVFSGIYDASSLFYAQVLDLSMMAVFILYLIALNIKKLNLFSDIKIVILTVILQSIYMMCVIFIQGQSGRILFGIFVLMVILSEYSFKKKNKNALVNNFIIAFILFTAGFIIWIFDATQLLCSPYSLVNGRGIYHILTALSILFLYRNNKVQNAFHH